MARTALITGGNRGLGLATARILAKQGFEVLLASRDPEEGTRAASALLAEGLRARAVVLDVTRTESIAALAQLLAAEEVKLEVLVNNAGVAFDGFDADVVRRTMAVNYHGAMAVSEALLPLLEPGARVVMVSSGMGELAGLGSSCRKRFEDPGLDRPKLTALLREFEDAVAAGREAAEGWPSSAYRVSKAALNVFTRIFAREHPELRINAVCPGWVRTRMGGKSASRSPEEGAASIAWAALLPASGPTGGFFRDGQAIDW